jgi:hypothetical protein
MSLILRVLRTHKFKTAIITNVLLLCWIIFYNSQKNIHKTFKSSQNEASKLIVVRDNSLLKFLYDNNVFLIDCDKLKEISMFNNASYLDINYEDFLETDLWFGVFYQDVYNLLKSQVLINYFFYDLRG